MTRDLATPLRIAWSVLGTPLGAPLRRLDRTRNTRKDAGEALAKLALTRVTPSDSRTYAVLRRGRLTWPDPSELARNHDVGQKLWIDSARLVGLPE